MLGFSIVISCFLFICSCQANLEPTRELTSEVFAVEYISITSPPTIHDPTNCEAYDRPFRIEVDTDGARMCMYPDVNHPLSLIEDECFGSERIGITRPPITFYNDLGTTVGQTTVDSLRMANVMPEASLDACIPSPPAEFNCVQVSNDQPAQVVYPLLARMFPHVQHLVPQGRNYLPDGSFVPAPSLTSELREGGYCAPYMKR